MAATEGTRVDLTAGVGALDDGAVAVAVGGAPEGAVAVAVGGAPDGAVAVDVAIAVGTVAEAEEARETGVATGATSGGAEVVTAEVVTGASRTVGGESAVRSTDLELVAEERLLDRLEVVSEVVLPGLRWGLLVTLCSRRAFRSKLRCSGVAALPFS